MFVKKEWDRLHEVIIHRPGTEIDYAMISPRAFLFERPFNKSKALKEHEALEDMLKENGAKVTHLKKMVIDQATRDPKFRQALESKVLEEVQFYGNISMAETLKEELVRNLPYLDVDTLFNILILAPSLDITMDKVNHMTYPKIFSNVPLTNLYFMRDQQAVSSKGVIVGRMKLPQRKMEPEVTKFIVENQVGETHLKRVDENTYFEGGDYIPCGEFGLIGTGPRTDVNGAISAMNSGMMDHDQVLVIENPRYPFMVKDLLNNMHLDTYFNIAGDGTAIGSLQLMKDAKAKLYSKTSTKYQYTSETTLYSYLRSKNYNIMDISPIEQLCYSSNFLTTRDKKIICIQSYAVLKKLEKNGVITNEIIRESGTKADDLTESGMFPSDKKMNEFGIDFTRINLEEITGGYGGAHCMTYTINRN
jgi:arginine deiminase